MDAPDGNPAAEVGSENPPTGYIYAPESIGTGQDAQETHFCQKRHVLREEFLRLLIQPISLFTLLLVILAGIQTCAFVSSERASVVPVEANFTREPVAHDKTVSITLKMKNGGKSTAIMEVVEAFIAHAIPPEPQYSGQGGPFATAPILPNDLVERPFPFRTEWGQDYIDRLHADDLPLYFFGLIRYRDEFSNLWFFGGVRETGFCFFYRQKGGVREPVFETCQERSYTYTH